MSYAAIDPIIDAWKKKHALNVAREVKDTPTRTTNVVSRTGEMFQIWINLPNERDDVGVHVWDYKDRKRDWEVPISKLGVALDEAVQTAKSWMLQLN